MLLAKLFPLVSTVAVLLLLSGSAECRPSLFRSLFEKDRGQADTYNATLCKNCWPIQGKDVCNEPAKSFPAWQCINKPGKQVLGFTFASYMVVNDDGTSLFSLGFFNTTGCNTDYLIFETDCGNGLRRCCPLGTPITIDGQTFLSFFMDNTNNRREGQP